MLAIIHFTNFRCRLSDLCIVRFDNRCHVGHAAVADFNGATVANGAEFVGRGEMFISSSFKNLFPILVETLLLNGGLNQMMLHFQFSIYCCCWVAEIGDR